MRAQAREVLIQARRGTPPPPARKLKLAGQVSDLFGALLEAYTREKLNGGKEAKSAVKNERTLKTACREWLTRLAR